MTKRKDLEVREIMYNYFNFNGTQINDLAIVTSIEKPYIPENLLILLMYLVETVRYLTGPNMTLSLFLSHSQ